MLKLMKWNRLDSHNSYLYTEDEEPLFVGNIYKDYSVDNTYILTFRISGVDRHDMHQKMLENCSSFEEAEWRSTVHIYNYCNRIVNKACKIRDHLPELRDLYNKMEEKESCQEL